MDILLDTHAVWWFLEGNPQMPDKTREIIINAKNRKYVSIASLWEVAIKMGIGKMDFDGGIDRFVETIESNGFILLGISPKHVKVVVGLPSIHRDPFDRMLVAQAVIEDMIIMTTDANILKYKVISIW